MNALAKKSLANQRKEHSVETYIQWVTTLSLAIRVCIYSFSCCCLQNLRNAAQFSQKFELISVQDQPRSSIYAISYWWSIGTKSVSPAVFKIPEPRHIWVTTLIFHCHVTSSVIVSADVAFDMSCLSLIHI